MPLARDDLCVPGTGSIIAAVKFASQKAPTIVGKETSKDDNEFMLNNFPNSYGYFGTFACTILKLKLFFFIRYSCVHIDLSEFCCIHLRTKFLCPRSRGLNRLPLSKIIYHKYIREI